MVLKEIKESYTESNAQFKAGAIEALCNLAPSLGKDITLNSIVPVLKDTIKSEEIAEIKFAFVGGLEHPLKVLGVETFYQEFKHEFDTLTKDKNWRVQAGIFECMAKFGT